MIVADKGLDRLLTYRLDPAKATIAAGDPPFSELKAGSGPRHFAFSPDARFGYVCNETASTIAALSVSNRRRGTLSEIQTISSLPADYQGRNTVAEITASANGRFVYASNRGHNSIAVFSRDPRKGTLSLVEHVLTGGRTPRSFSIDPTGHYLLAGNQATNNVVVFRIDAKTGRLTPTGVVVPSESPVCILSSSRAVAPATAAGGSRGRQPFGCEIQIAVVAAGEKSHTCRLLGSSRHGNPGKGRLAGPLDRTTERK